MSIYGKCTEEIKTKVPYNIKSEWAKLASDTSMNESELLRVLIINRLRGKEEIKRLQQERIDMAVGAGKSNG